MSQAAPLQPLWVQPSANDMLSQKFGATLEEFVVQCFNRGGQLDPPGAIDVTAVRQSDGVTIWDSGYVTSGGGEPVPPQAGITDFKLVSLDSQTVGPPVLAIPGGQSNAGQFSTVDVASQPSGGILSNWNTFNSPPVPSGGSVGSSGSLSQYDAIIFQYQNLNGITSNWVLVAGGIDSLGICSRDVFFGQIADETGAITWQQGPSLPVGLCQGALVALPSAGGENVILIYYIGGSTTGTAAGGVTGTTPVATVYYCQMPNQGSLTTWSTGTPLPAARCGHAAAGQQNTLLVMGGWSGSATLSTTVTNPINTSTGVPGAWSAGPAMTVGVKYAHCATHIWAGNDMVVWLLGGNNNANNNVATTQTCYIFQGVVGSFSATTSLPTAQARGDAAIGSKIGKTGANTYWVTSISGTNGAIASAKVTITAGVPTAGTWTVGGTGTPLTSSALGTGGSVVTNPDGSVTITFFYGAFGAAAVAIADGDSVAFTVSIIGSASQQLVSSISRVVNFGQPPTVISIQADGNPTNIVSGEPLISFVYDNVSTSVGGMLQARVRLMDSTDTITYFDTTLENLYQVQAEPSSPLVNGTTYHVHVLPTSTDIPYPGSTSSGSDVIASFVATSAVNAPSTPTLNSVTPNSALGTVDVRVTCPAGGVTPTQINVYYHVTGSGGPWVLLRQWNGAIVQGTPIDFVLADELALVTSYDYSVTTQGTPSAGLLTAESTRSAVIAASIPRPSGIPGLAGMLHVAGQAGVFYQIFRFSINQPKFTQVVDQLSVVPFGGVKPAIRYGPSVYFQLAVTLYFVTLAEYQSYLNLTNYAKLNSLGIYFRDYMGRMFLVSVPPTHDNTLWPDTFEQVDVVFQEQAYTYDPTTGI